MSSRPSGHCLNAADTLASLQTYLLRAVGGRGPLSESEAATLDGSEWVLSDCRRFAASLPETKQLIMNLGSFVINKLASVEAGDFDQSVKNVASLYVNSAAGVGGIVAERNQANESDEALPPVIPHQLAQQSHSDFCGVVRNQRERLLAAGWTSTSLDTMEQEHQALRRAFNAEPSLHALLSSCKDDVPFNDGWSAVKGRFESLHAFVGGIASVFPATAQVESDFSIVKAEKDDFRMAITDLSLEGILHSKQFSMLAAL